MQAPERELSENELANRRLVVQRAGEVQALKRELAGYELRGNADRAGQVKDALKVAEDMLADAAKAAGVKAPNTDPFPAQASGEAIPGAPETQTITAPQVDPPAKREREIKALERERDQYLQSGRKDRAGQVDQAIKDLRGAKPEPVAPPVHVPEPPPETTSGPPAGETTSAPKPRPRRSRSKAKA